MKTKGNIEVKNIKVGDIHYEEIDNVMVKMKVTKKPYLTDHNDYCWQSKRLDDNLIMNYSISKDNTFNLYHNEDKK